MCPWFYLSIFTLYWKTEFVFTIRIIKKNYIEILVVKLQYTKTLWMSHQGHKIMLIYNIYLSYAVLVLVFSEIVNLRKEDCGFPTLLCNSASLPYCVTQANCLSLPSWDSYQASKLPSSIRATF